MTPALPILFFIVATAYSLVGFGGGSSYTALLVLFGTPYQVIPILSLLCNVIVVSLGSWRFVQAGHLSPRLLFPFLVTSIPAAWWAGSLSLDRHVFLGLLAFTLFAAGITLLVSRQATHEARPIPHSIWVHGPWIGGILGTLAGLTGIGGGIFLSPLLNLLRWGKPQQIAASASLFILLNSLAGLMGQLQKSHHDVSFSTFSWLAAAVLGGGFIGSTFGSRRAQPILLVRVTAILTLYASIRLWLS